MHKDFVFEVSPIGKLAKAEGEITQLRAALAEAQSTLHHAKQMESMDKAQLAEREAEVSVLKEQLAECKKDTARMDFVSLYGSFGCDTVSGLPGGNGQKRLAATRSNVDAAISNKDEKCRYQDNSATT